MPAALAKLSPRSLAMLGISLAGAVLFLYFIMHLVSQPSYSTLETGLDPATTGKMTTTLTTAGIGFQLQNGGTALAVNSSQVAQARIALAGAGELGASTQPGMELFNSTSLGASNFQQQVTYQRALQGELAQNIDQIQGVSDAQVSLVLPDAQSTLFGDNSTPSSAAVLLSGTTGLDSGAVRGIAQLVASSVPGLSTDKVTITDGNGEVLWPNSSGGANGGLSQEAANSQYDSTEGAILTNLVNQTVGPGNAEVVVNGTVNANQETQQQLTYATKGIPTQTQATNETLTGTGAAASGVAGTLTAGATTGTNGNTNYKNTSTTTTDALSKTITNTTIAPGAVSNQTVSLVVSQTIPKPTATSLQNAVAAAAGIAPAKVTLSQMKFTPVKAPAAASPTASYLGYAKYVAVGIGALLFLLFTTRVLRKREAETLGGEPTWLRELQMPRRLVELERDSSVPVEQVKLHANPTRQRVEDLVKREPERVANQVRSWIQDE